MSARLFRLDADRQMDEMWDQHYANELLDTLTGKGVLVEVGVPETLYRLDAEKEVKGIAFLLVSGALTRVEGWVVEEVRIPS